MCGTEGLARMACRIGRSRDARRGPATRKLTTERHKFYPRESGVRMLVLSAGERERVIIGKKEVVITVVEIRPGRVRLGFEADTSIPIHREKVYDDIQRRGGVKDGQPARIAGN